jgi:hypothetical protein
MLLADMGSSHLSLIYLSLFATNYLKVCWRGVLETYGQFPGVQYILLESRCGKSVSIPADVWGQ